MRDFRQGPPRGRDGDAAGGLHPREALDGLRPQETLGGPRPGEMLGGLDSHETARGLRPPARANGSHPPASANGSHPQVTKGRSPLYGAARQNGQQRARYGWLLAGLALVVVTSGIWTEQALLVVGGVMIAAAAGRLLAPDAARHTDRRTGDS